MGTVTPENPHGFARAQVTPFGSFYGSFSMKNATVSLTQNGSQNKPSLPLDGFCLDARSPRHIICHMSFMLRCDLQTCQMTVAHRLGVRSTRRTYKGQWWRDWETTGPARFRSGLSHAGTWSREQG